MQSCLEQHIAKVVSTRSYHCNDVSKQVEIFCLWQPMSELTCYRPIFYVRISSKCWSITSHQIDPALGGSIIGRRYLFCIPYAIFSCLFSALTIPEESVLFFLQRSLISKSCFWQCCNVHIESCELSIDDSCFASVVDLSNV